MLFRNTTRKDVMVPILDPEHPNTPARHLAVKVGQDVDLPEKVGYRFNFAPQSMLGGPSELGTARVLTKAEIQARDARRKGIPLPKNQAKVQPKKAVEEELPLAEEEK